MKRSTKQITSITQAQCTPLFAATRMPPFKFWLKEPVFDLIPDDLHFFPFTYQDNIDKMQGGVKVTLIQFEADGYVT